MIQFSKRMIEKVYEIRRLSPPDFKSKIKLSSASLFDDLKLYYRVHPVGVLSEHIEELFSLAGLSLVDVPEPTGRTIGTTSKSEFDSDTPREIAKKESAGDDLNVEAPKLRKIVYRGQVSYVA